MNAVELEKVTKRFGTHVAVDSLDLVVPKGTIYGFIGPNGSGKTTTLRMILRIFHPDEGRIRVMGIERGSAADNQVGYLPEERGLYRKMRVREQLQFYAALKGLRRNRKVVDEWLERFGLAEWADKKVEVLSKGMSQKVQFIAAVVSRPVLVILDEPFSGLDPVNMEALKDAVIELRRNGSTIIFSTHDMEIAERMCDTIFMIFQGRKVLDGTLAEIQAQYGEDVIRVRAAATEKDLAKIQGVARVNDYGQTMELRMEKEADSQQILRELTAIGRVERFELARPALHDIFVRIAGQEDHREGGGANA